MLNRIRETEKDKKLKAEKLNRFFQKDLFLFCLLIGLMAFSIRFYLNFSHELIPGVNGGYYPLQVRCILSDGFMGFTDMPLLFYVDAFMIKLLTLAGIPLTDRLIIDVVKFIDSISLPLLIFPLFKIIRLYNPPQLSKKSLLAFSVLSFSPLVLTSDLQKNALAVVFLFCFLSYLLSCQVSKKKMDAFLSVVFLILMGLTHFGTFLFGAFFLLLIALHLYRKKAIIPVIILAAVVLGMVYAIDVSRFSRMLSVWSLLFEKPALLHGMLSPPDIVMIVFSNGLAIAGIVILLSPKKELHPFQKSMLFACIVCLFSCSFPLLDAEYFIRLSLFLFIPQILIILTLLPFIATRLQKALNVCLIVFICLSVLAVAGHPKTPVINSHAYKELKELRTVINTNSETLVVARHGLEWWTAWALHTKVAQDKAIDKHSFEKYKQLYILKQINGFGIDRQPSPLHEPHATENAVLMHSSENFIVYKLF